MRFTVVIACLLCLTTTTAVAWEHVHDLGVQIDTRDGVATIAGDGFVATGRYMSATGVRPFLARVDANGALLWSVLYDQYTLYDAGWGVAAASDGGFIIGGKAQPVAGGHSDDILVIRTDADGQELWHKIIDLEGSTQSENGFDRLWGIRELSSGDLIGCGTVTIRDGEAHDAGLVKMDSLGNLIWARNYGPAETTEVARDLALTSDGGFVLAGYYGYDGANLESLLYVVRTDADGNEMWSATFGDPSVWNTARWIAQTADGGFIVAGRCGEALYGTDGWVLKLSPTGQLLWQQVLGGDYNDFFLGGTLTADGGCMLTGLTQSYSSDPGTENSNRDAWVVRLDADGNVLSSSTHGSSGSQEFFADTAELATPGEFISAGVSNVNLYVSDADGTGQPPCDGVGDNTWDGCDADACAVCAENLTEYNCYFEHHPACVLSTTCDGEFFDCDAACPAPTAADRCACDGIGDNTWNGCRGNGCAVCQEKLIGYDCYFENHADCVLNTTCMGVFYDCDSACPPPTEADRCVCDGIGDSTWDGCGADGCAVCEEKLVDYPCYFDNHASCVLSTTCAGQFSDCDYACPAPTEADECVCSGIGEGVWDGCGEDCCTICSEKLVGYDCYFDNNPACALNTTCAGIYNDCNVYCPPPTEADRCVCDGIGDGTWDGCGGSGCAVCEMKLVGYDCYFENHTACVLNRACIGPYEDCDAACPPPTEADRCVCDGIGDNTWNGCRDSACAVCQEKLVGFNCYFDNHPQCVLHQSCNGQFSDCDTLCPAPTQNDVCRPKPKETNSMVGRNAASATFPGTTEEKKVDGG